MARVRIQVAVDVEGVGHTPLRPHLGEEGLQHRHPAEVRIGQPAPGTRVWLHGHRLRGQIQEAEGVQCILPALLRHQWHAGRGPGREGPWDQGDRCAETAVHQDVRGVRREVHRRDDEAVRDARPEHGPEHILPDGRALLPPTHPGIIHTHVQERPGVQGALPYQLVHPVQDRPRRRRGGLRAQEHEAQLHQIQRGGHRERRADRDDPARTPLHVPPGGSQSGGQGEGASRGQRAGHPRLRQDASRSSRTPKVDPEPSARAPS